MLKLNPDDLQVSSFAAGPEGGAQLAALPITTGRTWHSCALCEYTYYDCSNVTICVPAYDA